MAESGEVKKNEINPSLTERKKLSHKQLKTLRKKQKRKVLRQQSAIQRDEIQQKEEQEKENSPSNLDRLQGEQQAKLLEEREEWERKRQHELWLEREKRAQAEWRAKLAWEEKEKKRKQEEERLIKEEWEERQRLEKEEEEKKEKESLEKKRRQVIGRKKIKLDELLKEATKDSKTGGEPWHNPLAPQVIGIERERENCPFFVKVGACRFGNRCSRNHAVPDSSSIIMIPGMYANFEMEQSLHDEFDTDISLEYEDGERYQQYREFYEDVLPEFKSVGRIVQFKVSCNCEIHLRGNVYVQYKREEDAQAAFMKFNARWYAGKQLNCEFRDISRWKNAICGMFRQKRCPKGKTCNFLHVFRNPGNEFWEADRDFDRNISSHTREGYSQRSHYYHRYSQHERKYDHRSHRSRGRDRSRSRSRSPSHSRRVSRRRSRSRSRSRSYSPKRRRKSRSKSYSPKRKKSRSPSYSPSRRRKSHSRSRSYSPKRQRKSDSRSKSRSYSPKGRKRSRSPSISSNKKSRKKRHKSKPLLPSSERHCTESSLKYSRSPSIERRRKNHKHHKKKSKKKRKESRSETPAVPLVDSVTEWLENIPGSGKSASDPENNTDGAGTEPSDQEKNESAGTTKSGSPEKINNHDDLPETTSGRQSEAENDNRDLTNDIHLNGQVS